MIVSFGDKETEKVYHGEFSKKLPVDIQKRALNKLLFLDNIANVKALSENPGLNLESLKGEFDGYWSIRINKQWRIIFIPVNNEEDFADVMIVDYH